MITILLVFSFVLLCLAAFNVPCRMSLGWAGLACFVLAELVRGVHIL